MESPLTTPDVKWSDENIIDLIRRIRNDLLKDFLDERFLRQYCESKFGVRELSPIKTELIRKQLKEMLISPVSIAHYENLIRHIRENDSASLSVGNDRMFYHEIESAIKPILYF